MDVKDHDLYHDCVTRRGIVVIASQYCSMNGMISSSLLNRYLIFPFFCVDCCKLAIAVTHIWDIAANEYEKQKSNRIIGVWIISLLLHVSDQLTGQRFAKTFQARRRAIFTNERIIRWERYQFAQLKSNTRFMKPSIACSAQQFQNIQISIFAAKIERNKKEKNSVNNDFILSSRPFWG